MTERDHLSKLEIPKVVYAADVVGAVLQSDPSLVESRISMMCLVSFVFIKLFRPHYANQKMQYLPKIHPTCHGRPRAYSLV